MAGDNGQRRQATGHQSANRLRRQATGIGRRQRTTVDGRRPPGGTPNQRALRSPAGFGLRRGLGRHAPSQETKKKRRDGPGGGRSPPRRCASPKQPVCQRLCMNFQIVTVVAFSDLKCDLTAESHAWRPAGGQQSALATLGGLGKTRGFRSAGRRLHMREVTLTLLPPGRSPGWTRARRFGGAIAPWKGARRRCLRSAGGPDASMKQRFATPLG